jgi:MoxR-like ATPase
MSRRTLPPARRLALIARQYLADDDYLHAHRAKEARRLASLPGIQQIIAAFVAGDTDLPTFRDQLDAHLRHPDYDDWGARGFWMMTLNQLARNHDQHAATMLRTMLDRLSAANLDERSATFARFLEEERQRLAQQRNRLAAPGRSAFFLALFADWLDPDGGVVVPWPIVRDGLRVLLDLGVLPDTLLLARTWDGVRIASAQDIAAVRQAREWLAATEPELREVLRWWDKRFLDWVYQHRAALVEWLDAYQPDPILIPDAPLAAIEPEQLAQRIREVQQHILVPDHLLRRIYHALVLGQHIVLSGPPGTGKTALAALLPRMLWRNAADATATDASYAAQIVTATDEWTPRHVIGGIVPVTRGGQVHYEISYGCLARAILDNWNLDEHLPESWSSARRCRLLLPGEQEGAPPVSYAGRWLVIDEFNRAPIDLALGEALTAIGGSVAALNVPTVRGPTPLPIPQDFRIIGTLNTFDRHFLNRISEALKRRFTFIEVLPPPRQQREAEQAMVLHKVLARLQPVSRGAIAADGRRWSGLVAVAEGEEEGTPWRHTWEGDNAARRCFEEGWRLFEAVRLYRQFGTAQALGWALSYLGAGLLDGLALDDEAGWRLCLSTALTDTLSDQLQVLFPDELDALLALLRTRDAAAFASEYNAQLERLLSPRRRSAQVLALQSIKDTHGEPYLSTEAGRAIAAGSSSHVPAEVLAPLFHADQPRGRLPHLEERLERFLFERML